MKKEWIKHVSFLANKTKFKTVLLELKSKLKQKKLDFNDNIYHSTLIHLSNNKEAWLQFISMGETQEVILTIRTSIRDKLFFWDIMLNKYKF